MIRDPFAYISYLLVPVPLFHLVGINGIIENPVGGVVSSAACCPSCFHLWLFSASTHRYGRPKIDLMRGL